MTANLEPLDPATARDMYLDERRNELADETIQSHADRLKQFVHWCDQDGLENLNNLSGRDIHRFRVKRRNVDIDLGPESTVGACASAPIVGVTTASSQRGSSLSTACSPPFSNSCSSIVTTVQLTLLAIDSTKIPLKALTRRQNHTLQYRRFPTVTADKTFCALRSVTSEFAAIYLE